MLMLPAAMHAPDLNAAMEDRAAERAAKAAFEKAAVSMLVTGTIEIDAQGGVARFELDQQDKLPGSVARLLAAEVPAWRFEPILEDGQPVAVRTPMRVRVVARRTPGDPDVLALRVGGMSFGAPGAGGLPRPGYELPGYTRKLLRMGVEGTVYLLLKVGGSGAVEDVAVEQVNLEVLAAEDQLRKMRASLGEAATEGVRDWRFDLPAGDTAGSATRVYRLPLVFRLSRQSRAGYGKWTVYVPGPRSVPSWAGDAAGDADTFVSLGAYPTAATPRLLRPRGG